MWGCGYEERLALEHEGKVIISGISSFEIFIRLALTLCLFSAAPSHRRSLWSLAAESDILCLCVCARTCISLIILSLIITTVCYPSSFFHTEHAFLTPAILFAFIYVPFQDLLVFLVSADQLNKTRTRVFKHSQLPFAAVTPE